MNVLKMKIVNGKRKAYYVNSLTGLAYRITVSDYDKAKKTGKLHYGLEVFDVR